MKLTEACIRKPVLAWMIMAATVVFGAVAASRTARSGRPGTRMSIAGGWADAHEEQPHELGDAATPRDLGTPAPHLRQLRHSSESGKP